MFKSVDRHGWPPKKISFLNTSKRAKSNFKLRKSSHKLQKQNTLCKSIWKITNFHKKSFSLSDNHAFISLHLFSQMELGTFSTAK